MGDADARDPNRCANCGGEGRCIKGDDKVHPYRVTCLTCGSGTAHHGSFQGAWLAWTRRPAALTSPAVAQPVEGWQRMQAALRSIAAGTKLGEEMFAKAMKGKKLLTWPAVNILQDNVAAARGTAERALSAAPQVSLGEGL